MRSIAVLRALNLGDFLCSVPAFRALRAAFPAASVTLVGLPWAKNIIRRFSSYIDDFAEFPGYPGLPERVPDIASIPSFIASMQRRRFDLVLQMHGSGSFVNPVAMLFGARRCGGFYMPGDYCPDEHLFCPYPGRGSETRRMLSLIRFLGLPVPGDELEFPVTAADLAAGESVRLAAGLAPGRYACVHPGSQLPSRRWPAERFAAVADRIAAAGLKIVITGTAGERHLAERVQGAMRSPSVNLAGQTALGALAALLREARLLLSNDTGVSHIAAALGLPRVAVVTGSDPERWQSGGDGQRRTVAAAGIACRPCGHAECPSGHRCALKVSVDRVWNEVRGLLARPAGAAAGA